MTIAGTNSRWTSNGYVSISDYGTLNVTGGASVSNTGNFVVGSGYGPATLNVTGGSSVSNTGSLNVGYGSGTVNVTGGSSLSNAQAAVNGTVKIDGRGSTWTNNGELDFGSSGYSPGSSQFAITGGAAVSSTASVVGSSGAVTVDGPGSTWTNNGNLTLHGTLSVTGGAAVSNANSDGIVIVVRAGGDRRRPRLGVDQYRQPYPQVVQVAKHHRRRHGQRYQQPRQLARERANELHERHRQHGRARLECINSGSVEIKSGTVNVRGGPF